MTRGWDPSSAGYLPKQLIALYSDTSPRLLGDFMGSCMPFAWCDDRENRADLFPGVH